MAIGANQKDYRDAFKKHLHAYIHWADTGSDISKRLVLIYCVECGLKCLIMKQEKINNVADACPNIQKELGSHDFQMMLKRLKHIGEYSFFPITTIHGDQVYPSTYHQLCRYCIRPVGEHYTRVQKYDDQLFEITKWLEERV